MTNDQFILPEWGIKKFIGPMRVRMTTEEPMSETKPVTFDLFFLAVPMCIVFHVVMFVTLCLLPGWVAAPGFWESKFVPGYFLSMFAVHASVLFLQIGLYHFIMNALDR